LYFILITSENRTKCLEHSWLGGYAISASKGSEKKSVYVVEHLAAAAPYFYSFFFSAATLSSAGFGGMLMHAKLENIT